jgi:hypothetical protein
MLFDLKILKTTLEQIEVEKKIPQSAIIEAIEQALLLRTNVIMDSVDKSSFIVQFRNG